MPESYSSVALDIFYLPGYNDGYGKCSPARKWRTGGLLSELPLWSMTLFVTIVRFINGTDNLKKADIVLLLIRDAATTVSLGLVSSMGS